MTNYFNPDFFTNNRKRLQELVGLDVPIVITANGQLQAKSDNTHPFRQDSNFWYLTGLDHADYILVIDRSDTYIIIPPHNAVKDIFDGSVSNGDITRISGVQIVLDAKEGWNQLNRSVSGIGRVATLKANPSYIAAMGMYTNPSRARLIQRLKRTTRQLQITDVRPQLASLRVIKQEPEIAALQKAIDITCATLNAVQQRSYGYEYELEADITQGFRAQGATGHAYTPIVAGSRNACTLHYMANTDALDPSQLVLADVGAEYQNYAADITRTWSLANPTDRQRAVFDAVNDALSHGIEQLKPGVSFADCEDQIRKFVGQKLVELKLIATANPAEVHYYYPHAPHYLGLDVHDVGDYTQPLQPGMVLTLEPGIYIPDEGIGIRLEEDILITETGCKVLSLACPRNISPVQ